MPTRVILIRHGQTDWNLRRRYLGATDVRLNRKGLCQAKSVVRQLRFENISRIYSSRSRRAFDFARAVFGDVRIDRVSGLAEMDFGIFEGMSHAEITDKYPAIYSAWLRSPCDVNIPGGEPLKSFSIRVMRAFTHIIERNKGKTLAAVTHAGSIRIIMNTLFRKKNIWVMTPSLASVHIIEFRRNRWVKLP